ncbi:MAG: class I SAM-dependent methyltransferase [Clostridiales bacterium]|nr:class I SAM-dependent methyltransferase [Clostridiales bacterium]
MAHYYDENPQGESDRRVIQSRMHGMDFFFTTDSEVFSKKFLDFGSRTLLEAAIADLSECGKKKGKLLDLGCGYGPIGIIMKRVFPSMEVTMVDINNRALELARENAENNSVKCVDVHQSDGCSNVEGLFDVVLTNPPVRAGKQTVFSFYDGAFEHMAEGGRLYVVLQKKQGAPSSEKYLLEKFGNCDVIARESGYWIMRSVKS